MHYSLEIPQIKTQTHTAIPPAKRVKHNGPCIFKARNVPLSLDQVPLEEERK